MTTATESTAKPPVKKKAASKKTATKTTPAEIIPVEGTPAIYPAMSAVMAELEAIGKTSKNVQQNFLFRGVDAVYNAIHPLLAKYRIFILPRVLEGMRREERATRSGGTVIYSIIKMEFDFVSGLDGSRVTSGPFMGEAMDSGDKGLNKCEAVAHKYCLTQTFVVPYKGMEADDPDLTAHEVIGAALPPPGSGPTAFPTVPIQLPPINSPAVSAPLPVQPIQPVAPVAAAEPVQPPAPVDGGDTLVVNDAADAATVANWIINLIQSLPINSVDGLTNFWHTNKKVIDLLDTQYHNEYERVKTVFTELRIKNQQAQTGATP
jgi:hypothetical protein